MATSLRRGGSERARTATALTSAPWRTEGRRLALTLAVAGVVAVGIALRFATMSHLWLDEALTVNIARLPLSRLSDALRHDGSPPLYYVLMHYWIAVFGAGDVAVRALSAAFAIATLPLAWLAGQRLGGRRMGVAALVLLASSPFALRFATEARMYSLLGFLALAGYLFLQRLIDRPSLGAAAGVAVASGLLLLTHYWSIYLLGTVGVMIVVRAWRLRDRSALVPLAAMAAGGVLFVPWLTDFAYQLKHTGTPWAGLPTFSVIVGTVSSWAGGGSDAGELLNLVLIGLGVLAVFGLAVDRTHVDLDLRTRPGVRRLAIACLGTLLAGLVAADAFRSAYVVRYTSVAFPLFILIAAFGTLVFVDNRVRVGVLALAVLLGFCAGIPNMGNRRTEAGIVAGAINRTGTAGDVVAYCPDQLGPSVSRLLTVPVTQLTFPSADPPQFVDWVDYAQRNHAAATPPFVQMLDQRAGAHRIWLVSSTNYKTFGSKCSDMGDQLQLLRPHSDRVVKLSGKYEERMGLVRYDP
ncbi:MAG: glycosyltransferase family 39 protein [Acidimicrobiia bacterium]|nr:glycosyltransferase family 39 protein [Acidimicrobiia bacterium]